MSTSGTHYVGPSRANDWERLAAALAIRTTQDGCAWRPHIAALRRDQFVPWQWVLTDGQWTKRSSYEPGRVKDAYRDDLTLVTRVGTLHVDQAAEGTTVPLLRQTSSATPPSLLLHLLRLGDIQADHQLLYIGTGCGYGTALATRYLGDQHVTSVDIDPYITATAAERCGHAWVTPRIDTADATGDLPYATGAVDRIISTIAVRAIPTSWLRILRRSGRLIFGLAGTFLIATVVEDLQGGAIGQVEPAWAELMPARNGDDYPPDTTAPLMIKAAHERGDSVTTGSYPVIDVPRQSRGLASMLGLNHPDIQYAFLREGSQETALLVTHDSWARATAEPGQLPTVHQAGTNNLWDELDAHRHFIRTQGALPVQTAQIQVAPDGRITLHNGAWRKELGPASSAPLGVPVEPEA